MTRSFRVNLVEGGGGGGVIVVDTPLPVSGTVCGEPGALSVIVIVPVRVPTAVGVNVIFSAQFPPTGIATVV